MRLPWLDDAWQTFVRRWRDERLAHGLLLHGPAGMGKRDLANDMAALLLCLQANDEACGTCRSCALLPGGAHPDRFPLGLDEGKHQIRVGQVREVIASLGLTTTISARKVAIIEPAEAMNRNAANALLKNLEEPPGDTVLILVAHDPARLPLTVRSRCQEIIVRLTDEDQALAWLGRETGLDAAAARRALQAAAGSPLLARQLHAEGGVEQYVAVRQGLVDLLGRPRAAATLANDWKDIDPHRLWSWLSLQAAEALRNQLAARGKGWPHRGPGLDCGGLARLQRAADNNRLLAETPVRQDLLLQEWLLEWAGQPLAQAG